MDFSQGNTRSCFLFLADMDLPGVVIERQMNALDACSTRVAPDDLALRRAAKPEPNSSVHHSPRLSGEART